jgi:hypothetical protein
MSYAEFSILFFDRPELYLMALGICLFVYFAFLRKAIFSIFDPLFYNMVFAAFAAAVVLFLWFTKEIRYCYLIQFCATEIAYLVALAVIPNPSQKSPANDTALTHPGYRRFMQSLYLISCLAFVASQLSAYKIGGIPLFYKSRLEYYAGGGGFGLLSRVIGVSSFLCWYLTIYKFVYRWKIRFWPRIGDAAILLFLVTSAVLTGSKATFVNVAFLVFYFRFIHRPSSVYPRQKDELLAKGQRYILTTTVFGAMAVLLFSGTASSLAGAIYAFLFRVVMSGDVYFMAYPHDMLFLVRGGNAFLELFGGTLVAMRLIAPSSLSVPIGFQLFHNATGLPGMFGPNPRHNVFGLLYFGFWGSPFYSAALGGIVGIVRNYGWRMIRIGGPSELVFVYLAISIVAVNTDASSFIGDLTNLVMIGIPLGIVAFFLSFAAIPHGDGTAQEQLINPAC